MTPKSRQRPASAAAQARRTFVLDSAALSKAVRGDRDMTSIVKAAPQLGIALATSALTTLEAWNPHEKVRGALWDWTLSRVAVVHTDDRLVGLARSMLRDAALHGHKHAIDALPAAVARTASDRGRQVTIFTSDADGMGKLLGPQPIRIEKV